MSALFKSCETLFGSRDLYSVLHVPKTASEKQIRKAYHKLSLQVHPDKVEEDKKQEATEKFQVLGRIFSILSNKETKSVYDETGTIDEEVENDDSVDWLEFWRGLFKPITIKDIDDYEKDYIGSQEEKEDIKKAYMDGKGDVDFIFESVPFMTVEEEPRLRAILRDMIDQDQVPAFKQFTNETKQKRDRRKRKCEKEMKEAEKEKKAKGSGTMDIALAIRKNQEDRNSSFLKKLEEKYGGTARSSRSEKKGKKN